MFPPRLDLSGHVAELFVCVCIHCLVSGSHSLLPHLTRLDLSGHVGELWPALLQQSRHAKEAVRWGWAALWLAGVGFRRGLGTGWAGSKCASPVCVAMSRQTSRLAADSSHQQRTPSPSICTQVAGC